MTMFRPMLQMGLMALLLTASAGGAMADAAPGQAAVTVRSFYQDLSATMRQGQQLGFAGRRDHLEAPVQRSFDLPRMTRVAVGLRWRSMTPQQQAALVSAFGEYSAATYASRFTHDTGARFEVDPTVTPIKGGIIVHTTMVRPGDDPVKLDYLMRQMDGGWKIEDVYLSGTISELATRRSEFSSVLDRGGPEALVEALRKKAAG